MALDMRLEVTSGVSNTEVPDDVAADLAEAYRILSGLPVNRQIVVDFPDAKDARAFVRQGKAWAAAQEVTVDVLDDEDNVVGSRKSALTFARKGNVKENPTRVAFRIYVPRESGE